MSKTTKILSVCLVLAVISTVVTTINAFIDPATMTIAGGTSSALFTVILAVALSSSKKDNGK